MIYAARDFARFRKQFFFNLASTYYRTLLLTYRQIEIEAQNYFTQIRALDQAREEEKAGLQSRIQVDQIEQSMLQGRSRLISVCNSLEGALDRFKIDMGLPTEIRLDLDLDELFELTLRDEVAVSGERVGRALTRVQTELADERSNFDEIMAAGSVLGERFVEWIRMRQRLDDEGLDLSRPSSSARRNHARECAS